ncbi:DNA repair and recombination protein RAD26 [Plectosphaerella cucumerina]|uniref:DNA repair and recombination protein RAD26 n=1 Tax=Plectosphaerella cucumerina TaxID=40658 RepID=A0A8K0TD83_9PEZI|nr:DNA repair and recombination protein RAD26 [Plectosphaerella cucumerina]
MDLTASTPAGQSPTSDDLGVTIRDQDDVERDLDTRVTAALREQDDKRDQARVDKLQTSLAKLQDQKSSLEAKLAGHTNAYQQRKIREEVEKLDVKIAQTTTDMAVFQNRIDLRSQNTDTGPASEGHSGPKLTDETRQQYLIRTGKITPFAKIGGPRPRELEGDLADALIDEEEDAAEKELDDPRQDEPQSHQVLRRPGFEEAVPEELSSSSDADLAQPRPRKKRKIARTNDVDDSAEFEPTTESAEASVTSDSEQPASVTASRKRKQVKHAEKNASADQERIDDGDEDQYQKRLEDWVTRRKRARRQKRRTTGEAQPDSDDEQDEWLKPSPDHDDLDIADGLRVPGDITLLPKRGGILGDEMGLGKTIQIIAFIATLHHSGKLDKPVIVVAPATVLRQWVNEFHKWWPALRVSVLHSSGSGMANIPQQEDDSADEGSSYKTSRSRSGRRIIRRIEKNGGILVTTYSGVQIFADDLVDIEWKYAVLDEGHKIRNPNAEITITCKELNTPNRIILTGTPIQNNLTELWSLFDFVYPMRLGNLVQFQQQFEVPIKHGGYATATALQVEIAEKTAEALKEAIAKYLLQRLKVDVASDLPPKTEQVYYCHLTATQIEEYRRYLNSDECAAILAGRLQSFAGTRILGTICNHPDLLDDRLINQPDYDYGSPTKSGKLRVAMVKLQEFKRGGHKTLIFSQRRSVLALFEIVLRKMGGFTFLQMDGRTPIDRRQSLIDRFNNDPSIDIFLLTTHVGGLGVNLTGASRIIIYDPDWNPSVDVQARERAWRLGQTKPVHIIRLVTEGTIEDTIYHRQVYKQLLTNKVLKDPKQRASLELSGLNDLFTLVLPSDNKSGTVNKSKFLQGAEVDVQDASTDAAEATEGDAIAKIENYTPDTAEMERDKRIVDNIFAHQVANVYDHDAVMNGKKKIQADRGMNRMEAHRLGRIAKAHLDRSGREAQLVRPGEVTWTGERGTAGRPGVRSGGPSSSAVLNLLASRRGHNGRDSASSSGAATPSPGNPAPLSRQDFKKMIKDFITAHQGKVPSAMLIQHFNRFCKHPPSQKDVFLAALKSVATLTTHRSAGKSIWQLNDNI